MRRLHAARAAGFERLARVVEPHVAALHEQVRDVQVVVVDEGDAAAEHRVEGAPEHALQVVLGRVVGRMRLAGEDDLHRRGRRAFSMPGQPLGVVEDQLGALVGGEAARVADGERVGVEHRAVGENPRRGDPFHRPALPRAVPDRSRRGARAASAAPATARRRGWRRSARHTLGVVDAAGSSRRPDGSSSSVADVGRPPRWARARRW